MRKPRVDLVDDEAQSAFWAVVAKHYPGRRGDFSPDAQLEFDRACVLAIDRWLEQNPEPVKTPLDVLTAMGFEEISTGGGCTGLLFERPNGAQCLVTNDALAPTPGEAWDVGFYADQDDYMDGGVGAVVSYEADKLLDALAVIAAWRVG